ncbi:MAG: hypothetical protein ACOH1W_15025 [Tessaracoccus sp.]
MATIQHAVPLLEPRCSNTLTGKSLVYRTLLDLNRFDIGNGTVNQAPPSRRCVKADRIIAVVALIGMVAFFAAIVVEML